MALGSRRIPRVRRGCGRSGKWPFCSSSGSHTLNAAQKIQVCLLPAPLSARPCASAPRPACGPASWFLTSRSGSNSTYLASFSPSARRSYCSRYPFWPANSFARLGSLLDTRVMKNTRNGRVVIFRRPFVSYRPPSPILLTSLPMYDTSVLTATSGSSVPVKTRSESLFPSSVLGSSSDASRLRKHRPAPPPLCERGRDPDHYALHAKVQAPLPEPHHLADSHTAGRLRKAGDPVPAVVRLQHEQELVPAQRVQSLPVPRGKPQVPAYVQPVEPYAAAMEVLPYVGKYGFTVPGFTPRPFIQSCSAS